MYIHVRGSLRVNHTTRMRVTVTGRLGHPITGVRVVFDGRSVGISRKRHSTTGPKGAVVFKDLVPKRTGKASLKLTRRNFKNATVKLTVHA
jgi:hypothetical protein